MAWSGYYAPTVVEKATTSLGPEDQVRSDQGPHLHSDLLTSRLNFGTLARPRVCCRLRPRTIDFHTPYCLQLVLEVLPIELHWRESTAFYSYDLNGRESLTTSPGRESLTTFLVDEELGPRTRARSAGARKMDAMRTSPLGGRTLQSVCLLNLKVVLGPLLNS